VLWGQSCVGKTAFSKNLTHHHYYCFDYLFPWYDIETLGLPVIPGLEFISKIDQPEKFIIDGWVLTDKNGKYIPSGSVVYVIYAPYDQIIKQYRVPVEEFEQHLPMFKQWYYDIDYQSFPGIRYFLNDGCEFGEQSEKEFAEFLSQSSFLGFSKIQSRN